jgi:hypothetical protein
MEAFCIPNQHGSQGPSGCCALKDGYSTEEVMTWFILF